MTTEDNNQNKTALEQNLDYYIELENPGYAVMVTGAWGVGKTYQVKKYFENKIKGRSGGDKDRYDLCYISLYGMQSVDEIESKILAELYPKLSSMNEHIVNHASSATARISLGASKIISGAYDLWLKRKIKPIKTLVFDDLERCHINTRELLGKINSYVEHKQFRVIIICHDSKIKEELEEIEEKTIGRKINVEQDYEGFWKSLDSEKYKKLEFFKNNILETFQQSELKSFRILRYVLDDLRQIIDIIPEKNQSNKKAINKLVEWFLIIAFEVRGKKIDVDLLNFQEWLFHADQYISSYDKEKQEKVKEVTSRIRSRYSNVSILNESFIDEKTLKEIFLKAKFDKDKICDSLNKSPNFIGVTETDPLIILRDFNLYDDEIVESKIKELFEKLRNKDDINFNYLISSANIICELYHFNCIDYEFSEMIKIIENNIDIMEETGILTQVSRDKTISKKVLWQPDSRLSSKWHELNQYIEKKINNSSTYAFIAKEEEGLDCLFQLNNNLEKKLREIRIGADQAAIEHLLNQLCKSSPIDFYTKLGSGLID